ncbi:type II secretion system protein [Sporomusa sp.]|uniref:type IV pilus modification PilV family protein n=1 Tax=Sporomusa sp. TaxID=2078658 RepID=UPI002CFC2DB8|nr:type II secretion system protein [Sporomusa sp.]HWR43661.1 type II secretion system protein [Sporomusa sp.]
MIRKYRRGIGCILKNQRGWAYIDVIVAITILSIALTALAGTLIMLTKTRSASDHRTMAIRIIQSQFNDLQRKNHPKNDTRWTEISTEVQNIIDSANAPSGPGNVSLNFLVSVTRIPDGDDPSQIPSPGLQGVRMTVSWNGNNGQEQIAMSDYFFTSEANFSGGLNYVSIKVQ